MSNTQEFTSNLPLTKLAKFIGNKQAVRIELSDSQKFNSYYLRGILVGIDEYMNVIIEDAFQVAKDTNGKEEQLGKVLLKGDNILLVKDI